MLTALVVFLVAALVLALAAWRARAAAESRLDGVDRARLELAARVDALEQQRAADLQMLYGLSEGLLGIDRDHRVVLANRRFSELFEIPPAAGPLAGRPLHDVIRVPQVFAGFDHALAGEESSRTFSVRFGAVERQIEMRILPIASGTVAAVALFIDITAVERLERIRRNFVSDFSHEVRTPLAGLRSAVETYETAGERLTPDDDAQLRRIMSRQLHRLERLVNDLSELSGIESGVVPLELREIDLRQIVDELVEDFAEASAQSGVRLVVRGGHAVIDGDRRRIEQALSNLLDNAIKYGGSGKDVLIEIAEEPEDAVVRVSDQGEGIPESERDNIFRRFYRIDKSRSQDVPGTGLGLAIARHIVVQHRGSIRVESQTGEGAMFIVRLPKRMPRAAGRSEASR